jgi:hypothetical protein
MKTRSQQEKTLPPPVHNFYNPANYSVCIPSHITIVNLGELGDGEITKVVFEPPSRLQTIGKNSFACCVLLKSICIPRSVETIERDCFFECSLLSTVTFESQSSLNRIGKSAFIRCLSLDPICIPSSVEVIESHCFSGCSMLSTVTFESGSKLRILERKTFANCPLLKSFSIPASVQRLSHGCFTGGKLSTLVFESPSHIEELSLSLYDDYSGQQLGIPDSVMSAYFELKGDWTGVLILHFGRDSRLRPAGFRVDRRRDRYLRSFFNRWARRRVATRRIFARFVEGTLKAFRDAMEF